MQALSSALHLTVFGMGFVFSFLILLVFTMKLLSKIAASIMHNQNLTLSIPQNENTHDVDTETKHIITEAIKMHRGE